LFSFAKAEEYFKKALAIRVAEYGDSDAMVASTLHKLASLSFAQGTSSPLICSVSRSLFCLFVGNQDEGLSLLLKCEPILDKAIATESAKLKLEFIKSDGKPALALSEIHPPHPLPSQRNVAKSSKIRSPY